MVVFQKEDEVDVAFEAVGEATALGLTFLL